MVILDIKLFLEITKEYDFDEMAYGWLKYINLFLQLIYLISPILGFDIWNNALNSVRIDHHFPKHFGRPYQYTNDDVALVAAKIGFDYVQLWRTRILGRNIMMKKLEDLFQRHRAIYHNEINEAVHISRIIYKAALSYLHAPL